MKNILLIFSLIFGVINIFIGCKKESKNNNGLSPYKIIYTSYIVDSISFHNDTIFYDVNNDSINEIKLTMRFYPNGNSMSYGGDIIGVDSNMMFCYLKTVPEWSFVKLNDIITDDRKYNWLKKIKYDGSPFINSNNNGWALGVFTNYFGFYMIKNNKKYYGWFHLKYFAISEIGFNEAPNASILVGQK